MKSYCIQLQVDVSFIGNLTGYPRQQDAAIFSCFGSTKCSMDLMRMQSFVSTSVLISDSMPSIPFVTDVFCVLAHNFYHNKKTNKIKTNVRTKIISLLIDSALNRCDIKGYCSIENNRPHC